MFEDLSNSLDNSYTIDRLKEMIRIRSVVGEESELAEYLRCELEALGLETELQEVESGRLNVYGRLVGASKGLRLMFNGHTDTVPLCKGWETDPFIPVIKEGKLYGLGACDMKAGLACALTALKAFTDSSFRFKGELLFSGVIDEEAYSKGAKAMLRTGYAKCDAVVLCEPYYGNEDKPIPLGITGKILYNVTVRGRAAHGFRPHLGINAIEEAARIITSLSDLKLRIHPKFGKGNLCTLKIDGGYKVYSVVVPDSCRFEVNRLLVPGESADSAVKDMEELIETLGLEAKVEVAIKPPRYEPFILRDKEPILKVFHQVYSKIIGVEPHYEYASSITDANIFAGEAGIPCLHFGPKRGGAHQPNENVSLDCLPKVSEIYSQIAAQFLGA